MSNFDDGDSQLASPARSAERGSTELTQAQVDGVLLAAARTKRHPRLLMDGHCNVRWASAGAQDVLQPPLPLVLADRRLCTTMGGERGRAWGAFIEGLSDAEQRHFVSGHTPAQWVLVRGSAKVIAGQRLIFLECEPSLPLASVEDSGMGHQFGLTRGECSVLNLFARLLSPSEIAAELGVSLSTVRSHFKQIHTKMGVRSSVHLLRLTRAFCDK